MVASSYNDDKTVMGAIFGTGCNAAYMEDCHCITKLPKTSCLSKDMKMAINCEYGAYDNSYQVLPRTKYDETIDEQSQRPGEQTFEKMIAGLYLGEIFRLIMLDLHDKHLLLMNQDISSLQKGYSLDTSFLSTAENDSSPALSDTKALFQDKLKLTPTEDECKFLRRLAEVISVRGVRLCACGVAAICRKKGIKEGNVAADGSVTNKHPHFGKRWADALGEILGWSEDRGDSPIKLTPAEDGSGVGAAIVVAMARERGWV